MRFSELPVGARRYILYHALVSPILITWYLLPYYLLLTGYTVLEAGALFTAVNILSVPITLWLGKKFQSIDIKKGLIGIDLLESSSLVAYGFAYGPVAPIMILIGGLIEKAAGTMYFLYPAYERIIYPEDRMKEALSIHLRIPELSTIASYPIIGFVLGYIWPAPQQIRLSFLAFAAYQAVLALYLYMFIEPVKLEKPVETSGKTRSFKGITRRYLPYIVVDTLFILAWLLAPSLALVYYVMEWVHGNIFHVALIESAISIATVVGTFIVDRLSREKPGEYLSIGTIVTVVGLAMAIGTSFFPLVLIAFFIVRLGDSIVFVYKRLWLYTIMDREEASMASALISSIRRVLSLFFPGLAALLSTLSPRAPYVACLALLLSTIPFYLYYLRRRGS